MGAIPITTPMFIFHLSTINTTQCELLTSLNKTQTLYHTRVRLTENSNAQESTPNTQHFHEGH
jgi:hypothetical protein